MATPSSVNGACIGTSFCLYGNAKDSNIIFTVHSSANGWAGVALGSQMAGSDYYIGWKNSTSGITLSRRTAGSRSLPQYSSNQIATVVPLDVAAPSWAKLSFSFSRAIESDNSILATSPFIYGQSDSAPGSINDPQSSFPRHSLKGRFPSVNFLKNAVVGGRLDDAGSGTVTVPEDPQPILSSSEDQFNNIVLAHGVIFFLALVLSPFIGIFIARYLKDKLGVWWYRLHVFFMMALTGIGATVGFTLLYLFKTPHFEDTHQIFGICIYACVLFQIILGFVSNHMWTPDRPSVPWWDKLHWWFGRSIFLAGIINVYFGMLEYQENGFTESVYGISIAYWIFVAAGILVMGFGQWRFGQIHHVAKYTDK